MANNTAGLAPCAGRPTLMAVLTFASHTRVVQPFRRMTFRVLACAVLVAGACRPAAAQAPLSLADALARARASSPVMAAAKARVDAARAASGLAGRFLNPLVELRSENWANAAPDGTLPLDVFATVTQTLELGGKRGARRAVAAAAVTAAAATEALVWRDLARGIALDYLAALRARDHARARAEFATQMAEAARIMAARVTVGSAPEADLLKLRTEETRAALERTRADLAAARALASLGALLGTDVAAGALQMPPLTAVAGLTAVAETHPELQVASSAAAQARAVADVEHARSRPDLGVNAGFKRTAGFNTGVAALTVPIPLFDRNGVARALADGQVRVAAHELDAARQRLTALLAAARDAATTLAARAADVDATLVTPARGARDAARTAFAAGALDVLRLVDAERLYVDAAVAATDLDIDAVAAALEARLAAGEDPLP